MLILNDYTAFSTILYFTNLKKFLPLFAYLAFVNWHCKMNLRFFLTDKTLNMLFVGARKVLNVTESGVAASLHLDSPVVKHKQNFCSPDLKHNYKQMFLDSQCQLQSRGTIKVPICTGPCTSFTFVFIILCYSFNSSMHKVS